MAILADLAEFFEGGQTGGVAPFVNLAEFIEGGQRGGWVAEHVIGLDESPRGQRVRRAPGPIR